MSPRFLALRAAALPVVLASIGCTGQVLATADASVATTHAKFLVDRTATAGDDSRAAAAHVSAHVLRLQPGTDLAVAERLVGTTPALPAPGTCARVSDSESPGFALSSMGPVDLLFAGDIAVEAAGARATLAARTFPDVVDLVSGVVYTSRDVGGATLPAASRYRWSVAGAAQVPAFVVEADAPASPSEVTVAGFALGPGETVVPRGDLEIAFAAPSDGDRAYVEVRAAGEATDAPVRCSPGAGPFVTVPQALLPAAGAMQLSVHHVREATPVVLTVDGASVRFDVAVAGAVRFE